MGIGVVALACLVAVSLWRWPILGFAGAWFFVILSPTSSVVPVPIQPMAEHRMYLPLAGIIALVAIGVQACLGRRAMLALGGCAIALGWATLRRTADYRSELAIWSDTVRKAAAQHLNCDRQLNALGLALWKAGRRSEARRVSRALRLIRTTPGAQHLGEALAEAGRYPDAIRHYEAAIRLQPDLAEAHNNLGSALDRAGQLAGALAEYRRALELRPDYPEAQDNLGPPWQRTAATRRRWSAIDGSWALSPILPMRKTTWGSRSPVSAARKRR